MTVCGYELLLDEATETLRDEIERLTAEYSRLQELAAEFVDEWLGDGDGVELDGLAVRMAEALNRDSGRE